MVVRQKIDELLKLILALAVGRRKQFLYDLEYGHDVPFLRRTEFRDEQDRRREDPFRRVVKVSVLPKRSRVHARQDNGLGNDLRILLRFRLMHELPRPTVQIHIFVHKVQKVIPVRARGVTQVDDGYIVAVLPCDRAVVAHDVAFCVRGEERHPARTGIFDARVQPIRRLADACRASATQEERNNALQSFADHYPYIQFITLTDAKGKLLKAVVADEANTGKYGHLPDPGYDYSDRGWFKMPMQTGDMHIMDVYQSQFTGKLVITVSCPVTDDDDNIVGVIGVDIQLEQLLKRSQALQQEARAAED